MRNEEVDPNQRSLDDVAHWLQQTPLQTADRNRDRDRLMFLCGKAAASGDARHTSRGQGSASQHWMVAAVVLLAFGMGGLAGRWATGTGKPDSSPPSVASDDPQQPKPPGTASTRSAETPLHLDPQRVETIRSGHSLYAAMDPQQIHALPPSLTAAPVFTDTAPLRAGMAGQWVDQL